MGAAPILRGVVSSSMEEDTAGAAPYGTPVTDVSPQYRVVGNWEGDLQGWERIKNKVPEITPNPIK